VTRTRLERLEPYYMVRYGGRSHTADTVEQARLMAAEWEAEMDHPTPAEIVRVQPPQFAVTDTVDGRESRVMLRRQREYPVPRNPSPTGPAEESSHTPAPRYLLNMSDALTRVFHTLAEAMDAAVREHQRQVESGSKTGVVTLRDQQVVDGEVVIAVVWTARASDVTLPVQAEAERVKTPTRNRRRQVR
jgi:hypothetical protein